jgi:hypothetical protein
MLGEVRLDEVAPLHFLGRRLLRASRSAGQKDEQDGEET